MDTSRYARFLRPGHRVTGDRRSARATGATRHGGLRVRARDRRRPRPARLRGAPRRRESRESGPASSSAPSPASPRTGSSRKRLMTDNAFKLRQEPWTRELLAANEIRHLTTKRYRPQNERQGRTLPREDGARMGLRARATAHHDDRAEALPHWLERYKHAQTTQLESETGHRSAAFTTCVGRTTSALLAGAVSVCP